MAQATQPASSACRRCRCSTGCWDGARGNRCRPMAAASRKAASPAAAARPRSRAGPSACARRRWRAQVTPSSEFPDARRAQRRRYDAAVGGGVDATRPIDDQADAFWVERPERPRARCRPGERRRRRLARIDATGPRRGARRGGGQWTGADGDARTPALVALDGSGAAARTNRVTDHPGTAGPSSAGKGVRWDPGEDEHPLRLDCLHLRQAHQLGAVVDAVQQQRPLHLVVGIGQALGELRCGGAGRSGRYAAGRDARPPPRPPTGYGRCGRH